MFEGKAFMLLSQIAYQFINTYYVTKNNVKAHEINIDWCLIHSHTFMFWKKGVLKDCYFCKELTDYVAKDD